MLLKIYNTRTRKLEEFHPRKPEQVGLYTCGPTVYSTAHLGNLRTYIFEDVLRRTLVLNGYNVKHVMNVTDVGHLTGDGDMGEDKMELSAKKEKKSAYDIAAQHEQEFFRDLHKLNIHWPESGDENFKVLRATKTVESLQIPLIQKLEARGITYTTSDGVYFDTSKFPRYGELSGQKAGEKMAGARVEINNEKKNPTDFALWKFSKPADKRQMEWPSPWGVGFPGWHIECSAMSMHELGEQFDIHTGGVDHIAVHHENEIAQSEAATGKYPFVNIWMHGEFLKLPGKRMGKSEGNSITLEQITDEKSHSILPLSFRYLVLQSHYRKPLNFTWGSLRAANTGLQRLWATIAREGILQAKNGNVHEEYVQAFTEVVNDDLNTSKALDIMQQLIASALSVGDKRATLEVMDRVLGLNLLSGNQPIIEVTGYESLLEDYEVARQEKRFTVSDKIRADFAAKGLIVEDLPDGTSRLRRK